MSEVKRKLIQIQSDMAIEFGTDFSMMDLWDRMIHDGLVDSYASLRAENEELRAGAVRKELLKFSEAQEIKLKENDHKTHWSISCDMSDLMDMMGYQVKFMKKLNRLETNKIRHRAVNIANYAMMMFDKADQIDGSMDAGRIQEKEGEGCGVE